MQSWGIAYDSVRDEGGECVGIFRLQHVTLQWNGEQIEAWSVKSELRKL